MICTPFSRLWRSFVHGLLSDDTGRKQAQASTVHSNGPTVSKHRYRPEELRQVTNVMHAALSNKHMPVLWKTGMLLPQWWRRFKGSGATLQCAHIRSNYSFKWHQALLWWTSRCLHIRLCTRSSLAQGESKTGRYGKRLWMTLVMTQSIGRALFAAY